MKPYKSNTDKENCSPISSNCVTWQGPDIPCINLCKGDSVSDVVYKVASELCEIQAMTDLTDLDVTCLLELCETSPDPERNLAAILQLIVDKVCCTNASIITKTRNLATRSEIYIEPDLPLPACLHYTDPTTGLVVTTLVLSDYVLYLASVICEIRSTVNIHTSQIANHELRIIDLETAPCCYVPPTVVPSCSYGPVTSGVPTDINILLEALDSEVCDLITVLGTNTEINNAAGQQCTLLGSQSALSQPGTMSTLPNWNGTISNLAQSIQNLWITVCDMRAAIYDLRDCCSPDCSQFLLGYVAGTADGITVTLTFNSATVIPSGFSNCPLLSSVSITDGDGHTYTDTFDLVSESTNPSGISFDVSTAFLNPALPYTITVNGCIVNDGVSCTKQIIQTLPAAVPPACNCYTMTNPTGPETPTRTFTYTDCNGLPQFTGLEGGQSVNFCARPGSITYTTPGILTLTDFVLPCGDVGCPTTTTTTASPL